MYKPYIDSRKWIGVLIPRQAGMPVKISSSINQYRVILKSDGFLQNSLDQGVVLHIGRTFPNFKNPFSNRLMGCCAMTVLTNLVGSDVVTTLVIHDYFQLFFPRTL